VWPSSFALSLALTLDHLEPERPVCPGCALAACRNESVDVSRTRDGVAASSALVNARVAIGNRIYAK